MPETSIIIRTKNEEKWIGQCLKILSTQSYKNFEILIIDSGSTDRTLEIAKKYNTRILKIKPNEFSYPYALNYGCKNSNATKYFVFLSGHSLPISNSWLADGIQDFALSDKVAGVYGCVWALPDGTIWEKILFSKPLDKIKHLFSNTKIISTPKMGVLGFTNAIIRRDLWEKYNFNEAYGLGGEDGDWVNYWFKKGYKVIKDIRFSAYHSHGLNLSGLMRQRKYWASTSTPRPFKNLEFRNKN